MYFALVIASVSLDEDSFPARTANSLPRSLLHEKSHKRVASTFEVSRGAVLAHRGAKKRGRRKGGRARCVARRTREPDEVRRDETS